MAAASIVAMGPQSEIAIGGEHGASNDLFDNVARELEEMVLCKYGIYLSQSYAIEIVGDICVMVRFGST